MSHGGGGDGVGNVEIPAWRRHLSSGALAVAAAATMAATNQDGSTMAAAATAALATGAVAQSSNDNERHKQAQTLTSALQQEALQQDVTHHRQALQQDVEHHRRSLLISILRICESTTRRLIATSGSSARSGSRR